MRTLSLSFFLLNFYSVSKMYGTPHYKHNNSSSLLNHVQNTLRWMQYLSGCSVLGKTKVKGNRVQIRHPSLSSMSRRNSHCVLWEGAVKQWIESQETCWIIRCNFRKSVLPQIAASLCRFLHLLFFGKAGFFGLYFAHVRFRPERAMAIKMILFHYNRKELNNEQDTLSWLYAASTTCSD